MKAFDQKDEINIIKGIKEGNVKSFELLFNKYYTRYNRFVMGFVKDDCLTEDILQNIFMKIWINRESLREDIPISTYLYVLAKYEVFNHLRAKRNHLVYSFAEGLQDNIMSDLDVETDYRIKEMNEIVEAAVESIPEQRRRIFKMSRNEYKSAHAIAEETGLSVRTVEKHIELALKDLRGKLGPLFSSFISTLFALDSLF